MPQKYGKNMQPINGYQANPDTLREVQEIVNARRERRRAEMLRRKFEVSPEESKILQAIERMPEGVRQDAAEGALISRVAKRKGFIR